MEVLSIVSGAEDSQFKFQSVYLTPLSLSQTCWWTS